MPFTRTNGIKDAAELCDKYAAPASCNTENPPTVYDLGPNHVELATTGMDAWFTNTALLIGLALLVAGLALFIVLAIRARRDSLPSQVTCSLHKENHWPQVVHHSEFTYYPDSSTLKIEVGGRQSGKTLPRVYKGGKDQFYIIDPLKVHNYTTALRDWETTVEKVKEIHRDR